MKSIITKFDVLKGYKTKIAGLGLVLLAVSEYLDDKPDQAMAHLLEGIGLIGISFKIDRSVS